GLGVAILPAPLVEDEVRAGRLRALFRETDSAVAYHVLTRPGVISASRESFVRWLQRQAPAE
ncbi:MAG: LysR family transcriptional regulator, partial [Gammaproteobacteria bacterium]|nr:LysR family transcriptional regulator [Gammaproteobacteria bacterium]